MNMNHHLLTATLMLSLFGITISLKPIHICDERRGMTTEQVKLCHVYWKHMTYVIESRTESRIECEKHFAGRRWNCTFPSSPVEPLVKPIMKLPTRETAYVYALSAASIMSIVSRACFLNELSKYCGCSQESRPEELPKSDLWGGCGDNLEYGYKFSKEFSDAAETLDNQQLGSFSKVLMNLHNYEAGRWAVFDKSYIQCRCHGVTKNCATRLCYRQLARFKEVGNRLQELYQSSIQVQLEKKGELNGTEGPNTEIALVEKNTEFNRYSSKDLIYLQDSPSYCDKDDRYGIFGTRNRKCVKDPSSLNDCSVLCCGRGHHTRREIIKEKCGCRFVYCCEVKCNICEKEMDFHYCK